MGMGGVRGFDLRAPGDAGQLAAVSFWENADGPRAWVMAQPSDGWTDALVTTLGLAYIYPWPSGCDDAALRNKAWAKAAEGVTGDAGAPR